MRSDDTMYKIAVTALRAVRQAIVNTDLRLDTQRHTLNGATEDVVKMGTKRVGAASEMPELAAMIRMVDNGAFRYDREKGVVVTIENIEIPLWEGVKE